MPLLADHKNRKRALYRRTLAPAASARPAASSIPRFSAGWCTCIRSPHPEKSACSGPALAVVSARPTAKNTTARRVALFRNPAGSQS